MIVPAIYFHQLRRKPDGSYPPSTSWAHESPRLAHEYPPSSQFLAQIDLASLPHGPLPSKGSFAFFHDDLIGDVCFVTDHMNHPAQAPKRSTPVPISPYNNICETRPISELNTWLPHGEKPFVWHSFCAFSTELTQIAAMLPKRPAEIRKRMTDDKLWRLTDLLSQKNGWLRYLFTPHTADQKETSQFIADEIAKKRNQIAQINAVTLEITSIAQRLAKAVAGHDPLQSLSEMDLSMLEDIIAPIPPLLARTKGGLWMRSIAEHTTDTLHKLMTGRREAYQNIPLALREYLSGDGPDPYAPPIQIFGHSLPECAVAARELDPDDTIIAQFPTTDHDTGNGFLFYAEPATLKNKTWYDIVGTCGIH